jgi:hypothetical protein
MGGHCTFIREHFNHDSIVASHTCQTTKFRFGIKFGYFLLITTLSIRVEIEFIVWFHYFTSPHVASIFYFYFWFVSETISVSLHKGSMDDIVPTEFTPTDNNVVVIAHGNPSGAQISDPLEIALAAILEPNTPYFVAFTHHRNALAPADDCRDFDLEISIAPVASLTKAAASASSQCSDSEPNVKLLSSLHHEVHANKKAELTFMQVRILIFCVSTRKICFFCQNAQSCYFFIIFISGVLTF